MGTRVNAGWVRWVTVAAVVVVAAIAAVISYAHMQELALQAGEGWRAHLLPLAVDGLLVAASMTMVVRRRANLPAGWLAWVALVAGVSASLAANVAAADPTVTARLLACWPPLAFAAAFELLLQQGRVVRQAEPVTAVGEVAETPAVDAGPGEVGELVARARELVGGLRAAGRPVGRRTLAQTLGISEHRARALLAEVGETG